MRRRRAVPGVPRSVKQFDFFKEIAMIQILPRTFKVDLRLGALVAILALGAMRVSASTIIAGDLSTQSPPFDSGTGDAWAVGLSSNIELAVGFQDSSSSSYLLSQIQVADNFSVSDPNSSSNPALNDLIVTLWVNTVDDPNTATELQTWDISAPATTGQPGQLYTLDSATPTTINPGDYYFITENVTPDGSNTAEWGWQDNNLTPQENGQYFGTNGTADSLNYSDDSTTAAYSVSGTLITTTTPEPDNYALLLGAAFAGILMFKRRSARVQDRRS